MKAVLITFLLTLVPALILRPIITILHELGHAITAIILTKQKVSMYVGSYGDPTNSFHFIFGKLEIWLKYNPFLKIGGLCVYKTENCSTNNKIFITLAGPLISFILATVGCYIAFAFDLHGSIKLIVVIFSFLSIFDLWANLYPSAQPVDLYTGTVAYNDGYQLKQLFAAETNQKIIAEGRILLDQFEFGGAGMHYYSAVKRGVKNEFISRVAVMCLIKVGKFSEAKEVIDDFILHHKMIAIDFENAGLVYSHFQFHEKALDFFYKSLELNPDDKKVLNQLGFTLTALNQYAEAIQI